MVKEGRNVVLFLQIILLFLPSEKKNNWICIYFYQEHYFSHKLLKINRAIRALLIHMSMAHKTIEGLTKMLSLQNPNEGNSFVLIKFLVGTVHKPLKAERETPNFAFLIRF